MKRLLPAVLCLFWVGSAHAAAITAKPCSQYALPTTCADFAGLIGAINAIVTPLIPNVAGSVNTVSLVPAVTGGVATIVPGSGSDANASIGLAPNGNGNIVLFQGDMGGTGLLQFGNQWSFVAGQTMGPFPGGSLPGAAGLLGVHSTVQGVLLFKDWLGFTRGVAAY